MKCPNGTSWLSSLSTWSKSFFSSLFWRRGGGKTGRTTTSPASKNGTDSSSSSASPASNSSRITIAESPNSTLPSETLLVRPATSEDLPGLVEVEHHAAWEDVSWSAPEFWARITDPQATHRILVCEHGKRVVAYLCWQTFPKSNCIVSLVVHPDYRRLRSKGLMSQGIGSGLVWVLKHLAREEGWRDKVVAFARASNLPYQLFLKANDFVCDQVEENLFSSPDEEGLRFVWSSPS